MSMLWELHQYQQINQATSTANRSSQQVSETKTNVQELERRLDKLMLINMAMWSLLQEVSDLTENDLEERIKQIDLADGQLDGKVRNQAQRCSECNRVISAKHSRCLYCGSEAAGEHGVFSNVL